jgi:predicted phosphodiesterase
MTLLVVGDIHGCADELAALLALVRDPARELVLVGDLVRKGPDSAGVVALARERGARAVLGNHDAKALRWRADRDEGEARPDPELRDLGEGDWAYLASLPLYLELDVPTGSGEMGVIVVHGGLVPGVPVANQRREHLLNLRSIDRHGEPSRRVEGVPWASQWPGPRHAVFGHDAVRGLQRHPHATGLDTGCVYGGALTGLLLPENELVEVRARRAYHPEGAA